MGNINYKNEETGQDYLVNSNDLNRQKSLKERGFTVDTINSQNLKQSPPANFSVGLDTPVYDISKMDVPELTKTEEKVQGLGETMADLNRQLLGQSAFTAKQEQKQGLPDLYQQQTDLSNRIKTLQAEQQAIPLQIQQESKGRGRTQAGVAPLQTARLRNNAIQALSTNALLQATQGNISTAQTLVDRAVAQEFDPIREQIDLATKNLQIIKNSPQYSLEQKARADEQLAIQEAKKKALDKQEADKKAILNIATEVAKFGVSTEVLNAIRNARTPLEATHLAQATGVYDTEKLQREFENSLRTGEFNLKKQQIQNDLEQQAFNNDMSIMGLELDRDKYETDTEFRNAQLALENMKANYTKEKIQADIDKIYDDIAHKGEPSPTDLINIQKYNAEIAKKKAEADAKRRQAGKNVETIDLRLNDIQKIMPNAEIPENATPEERKKIEKQNKDARAAIANLVGTGKWGRTPMASRWSAKNKRLAGTVKQIIDQKTLDTLIELKKTGATLGAISEKELEILKNAATKLNFWEDKDPETGLGLGTWDTSEDLFIEELTKIQNSWKRLRDAAKKDSEINGYQSMNDYLKQSTPEQQQSLDALQEKYPDMDENDLLELINEQSPPVSFNSVDSDTNLAGNITLGSRLAKVNNNPGNLRLAGQQGATQGEGGFARFNTPEAGVKALRNDILAKLTGNSPAVRSKLGRDAETLREVISIYAPKEDNNDPNSYANFIAKQLGISPDEPVKNLTNRINELTRAFMLKESSSKFV